MQSYIGLFADKIRQTSAVDELIKVENFHIDGDHIGYLYAYKTERGVHIETSASIGDLNFEDWSTIYCGHTLHEYLDTKSISDSIITLESRIERLLSKTVAQLDILAPIERENASKPDGKELL